MRKVLGFGIVLCGLGIGCDGVVKDTTRPVLELSVALVTAHTADLLIRHDEPIVGDVVVQGPDNDWSYPPQTFDQNSFIYDLFEVSLEGLHPNTKYVALVHATDLAGWRSIQTISFTTEAEPLPELPTPTTPAPTPTTPVSSFIEATATVGEVGDSGATILISYQLTAPGRVYISMKFELSDSQWAIIEVDTGKTTSGNRTITNFRTGRSFWFLVQTRDDSDRATDSRVLLVNVP